jgi:uncharacterized protein YciW
MHLSDASGALMQIKYQDVMIAAHRRTILNTKLALMRHSHDDRLCAPPQEASMTLIEKLVGAPAGSPLAEALASRADILRLSEASHDAVIIPQAPGGLGHGLRAALAARMARQYELPDLAEHYEALMRESSEIEEPHDVSAQTRATAVVAHADLLTLRPRDATRADIEKLKAAGLTEPDIVRLAELSAFVSYQARVIKGLQALKAAQ